MWLANLMTNEIAEFVRQFSYISLAFIVLGDPGFDFFQALCDFLFVHGLALSLPHRRQWAHPKTDAPLLPVTRFP